MEKRVKKTCLRGRKPVLKLDIHSTKLIEILYRRSLLQAEKESLAGALTLHNK
jgi:hypothetical protein